jgi:hypothetical protein
MYPLSASRNDRERSQYHHRQTLVHELHKFRDPELGSAAVQFR